MNPEEKALESFIDLSSGLRIGTEDPLFERIKNAYSHLVVVEVTHQSTSLIEFANAGNATYSSTIYIGAHYWSPEDRKVKCTSRFASYKYSWNGKEFIVLEVCWRVPTQLPNEKFYIVHKNRHDIDGLIEGAGEWTSKLHNEVAVFTKGNWTKSKNYFNSIKECSWDNVTINREEKARLSRELPDFFDRKEVYRKFKAPWKRGIILHGPAGNGKSTAIRALMNQGYRMGAEILVVKSFEPPPIQTREDCIESVFEFARKRGRCILVLEDMDQLLGKNPSSFFLNEMDGIERIDGLFCIASVNNLERLDPALSERPSRFDQKYYFPLPSSENRAAYMAFLMRDTGIEFPSGMAKCAAAITTGFSYASLKEVMLKVAKEEAQPEPDAEPEAAPKTETELGYPDDSQYGDRAVYKGIKRHAAILKAQMRSREEISSSNGKRWSGRWQMVALFLVVLFALVRTGTWLFSHGKLEGWAG